MFPVLRGSISAGGDAFSPDEISGLELWLDETTHNFPTGWSDRSGNGNDALVVDVVPTVASGQINGVDAVEFAVGSNDYLKTAAFSAELTQPNTIVWVGYSNNYGTNIVLTDGILSNKRHLMIFVGTSTQTLRISAGTNLDSSTGIDITSPTVYFATYNGASSTIHQEASLLKAGNAGVQGLTGLVVGDNYVGSGTYGGWMGEILVYNSALTEAQRSYLIQYFYKKWATPLPVFEITSHPDYSVVQRDGSNQADLEIAGTYYDRNVIPTSIEYRLDDGDWATLDAAPANGAFSGTISNVSGGQYSLQVRYANYTSKTATANYIGVGDVFVVAGQSNASGRGTNNQSYTHATLKAALFGNDYLWQDLVDPSDNNTNQVDDISDDSLAAGSAWPLIATSFMTSESVPIAFIPCSTGGSSINQWSKTIDNDRDTLYGSMQYRVGQLYGIKAVLFHQGERDVALGTDPATYETKLDAFVDDVATDLSVPCILANLHSLLTDESAYNAAIASVVSSNANAYAGPDNTDIECDPDYLHFTTDAEISGLASRWWGALQTALGY